MRKTQWLAIALTAGAVSTAKAEITNFSRDVAVAIDRGLQFFDNAGVFQNPSAAGDGAGLAALALLEKRQSADPNSPPVGYANALPADRMRMDQIFAFIIQRASDPNQTFYAYRDGGDLMALSIYIRTGGPDQMGATNAIRATFDRIHANQGMHGYWCYNDGSCQDSSTTQLVMAGLAAARGVFSDPQYADAMRLMQLDQLAAHTRAAYQMNGQPGDLEPMLEKGHGYNVGHPNSLQQTASGLWGQIIGGADLNDDSVQAYLRWIRNRYNYATTEFANGGWTQSYFYFLWSSSKAFKFLDDSGVAPTPGHLSPSDLGLLPPGDMPAFIGRAVHRDPSTDPRVPSFGPGAAGYYASPFEPARWYYDYAYTILTEQDANGQFQAPANNAVWNGLAEQAYALLVLERSLGGGCADTDHDGVCDVEDTCPDVANPQQADSDGDGHGDACDNCPNDPNREQIDTDGDGIGDVCEGCPDNPKTEVCDGVDNDCDGQVDEDLQEIVCSTGLPGRCAEGRAACGGVEQQCEPLRQPIEETCNGLDDNCDGHIDEGVRNACGTCDASVPAETCNGVDDDCNGTVDDNAPCDGGRICRHGVCEDPCAGVECPEGQVCIEGYCADACVVADCPRGFNCMNGQCMDPCEGVQCEAPLICFGGHCVADDCLARGCEEGQRCRDVGCEQDPCVGVQCDPGSFCQDGTCVPSCAAVACDLNQRCVDDGSCAVDRCFGVDCPDGFVCRGGECRSNLCAGVNCDEGRVCIDGTCIVDPCSSVRCPPGEACFVTETGGTQCKNNYVEPPPYETPDAGAPDGGAVTPDGGATSDGGATADGATDDAGVVTPHPDGGAPADMGGSGSADAAPCNNSDKGGCDCNVGAADASGAPWMLWLLGASGVVIRRRRR
jgi:MYXO-CTERM domain-containing protein